jgi:hypothetical protein
VRCAEFERHLVDRRSRLCERMLGEEGEYDDDWKVALLSIRRDWNGGV